MSSIVILSVLVLLCASGLAQESSSLSFVIYLYNLKFMFLAVSHSRRDWIEKKTWGSAFRQETNGNGGWNNQAGSIGWNSQGQLNQQIGQDGSVGQVGQDSSVGQGGQDSSFGQVGQGGQDLSVGQVGQDSSFGQVGQVGSFGQFAPIRQTSVSKSVTRLENFKFQRSEYYFPIYN